MNNLLFYETKLVNQIQLNIFCLQCTAGHGGSVERIDPEGVEWVDGGCLFYLDLHSLDQPQ